MNLASRVSRRAAVQLASFSAVGGALLRGPGNGPAKASAAPGNEIVGSWDVTIDSPLRAALQTYTIDGGFTSTHGDHLNRSPAHGAWVRTGERSFAVQLVNLAFVNGGLAGKRVTRIAVTVDPSGNSYTALFHYDDFDLNGALQGSVDGASSATRISVQPPG